MSLEERNDFFVERKQWINSETRETFNVICAQIKDNEIDTYHIDYIPSKNFGINNNISRIRIPAALFVADKITDPTIYKILIKSCIKQVGAHLMVNSEGCLSYVCTDLDEKQGYESSNLFHINDVYPCFVNPDGDHKLCLGLRFTSNLNEGFRSFSRIKDKLSPSGGVFDLTEELFDPKRIKTGINSKSNRALFPSAEDHYIIYMCSGSKLIVEDDRFFELSNQDREQMGKNMNASLFQSGSTVVFTGQLLFDNSYSVMKNERREESQISKHLSFDEAVKKGVITPEDGLYKHWFRYRRLHKLRERVIFIGHNYSVHNSICWRLKINYLKKENNNPSAVLTVPEGGHIVDIQDWNWGMAEIYWRHCFELLYEKVLVQGVNKVYEKKNCFDYFIPTIKGRNTFYWERKIFGVGVNFNSWQIKLEYKYKGQNAGRIPPFYEQYTDWIETVPPFAPPLHPPVYCKGQFYYLPYKTCPLYLNNQMVSIRGQLFRIKYKQGVEEYYWTDTQRVNLHKNKNFSIDQRLGVDQFVYKRKDSVIGRKTLFYFEYYSNKTQEKAKEFQIIQWIQQQNNGFGNKSKPKKLIKTKYTKRNIKVL